MNPAEWSALAFTFPCLAGGAAMSQMEHPPMWLSILVAGSAVLGGVSLLMAERVERRHKREVALIKAAALEEHRRRVVRFMRPGLVDRAGVLADLEDYRDRHIEAAGTTKTRKATSR